MNKKPNYGFDAPHVIRWLFVFSFFCGFAALYIPTLVQIDPPLWKHLFIGYFLLIATVFFLQGIWMLYGTQIGKESLIRELTQKIALKGDEQVLDVGCGRGLFLIELAKRLPLGKAYGIDLWLDPDQQPTNGLEIAVQNAQIEGVASRIELKTADMQAIPFPDSQFDWVVSSLAIHQLKQEEERRQALKECLRVLKPGGQLLLLDMQYTKAYAHFLQEQGCKRVAISSLHYRYFPPIRIVKATKE